MSAPVTKIIQLVLIPVLFSCTSLLAQMPEPSAACTDCGRSAEYIKKYGHAPTCKYYVAPAKKSSAGSAGQAIPTGQAIPASSTSNSLDKAVDNSVNFMNTLDPKTDPKELEKTKKEAEIRKNEENERYDATLKMMKSMPSSSSRPNNSKTGAKISFQVQGTISIYTGDGRKVDHTNINYTILDPGSKIITGKDGIIKLDLPDSTRLTIGPESEFLISSFEFENLISNFYVYLRRGIIRWISRYNPGYVKRFEIHGMVTCAVRGTDFITICTEDKGAEFLLYNGEIELETSASKERVILTPGKKATITPDGKLGSFGSFDLNSPVPLQALP